MGAGEEQFQISGASKEKKIEIRQQDREYRQLSAAQQEATRRQSTYHLTKQLGQEDARQLNEEDRRNKYQRKKGLLSIRAVIREKIHRRTYRRYNSAVQSQSLNDSERTLKLHHALGQKFADDDKNVLEIDCAGSSFDLFRKEHTGFHGKSDISSIRKEVKKRAERLAKFAGLKELPKEVVEGMVQREVQAAQEHMKAVYGDEYRDQLDKKTKFSYRKKSKTSSKTGRDMTRYTLSGPIPLGGLVDWGDYEIEKTKQYVLTIAQDYIYDHLRKDGTLDKDIVINLQGHSRGGVAAGVAVHILTEWLKSPECAAFADKVKINLIQRDPVPGPDSRLAKDHDKMDLRIPAQGGGYTQDPHLNVTSLMSYHTDHTVFFKPQEVRGQQRIVVMQEKHGVGLDQGDGTQKDATGATKWHEMAGIDAATMQAYRGSGYSELGNGVWLMDEDNVLVRVRSYGEAVDVLRKVASKTFTQSDRHAVIERMIKNWFIDNDFVDDQLTAEEFADDLQTKVKLEDELFDSVWGFNDSDEMAEVKVAALDLRLLMGKKRTDQKTFNEFKDKLDGSLDRAIEACRNYMEKKDPVTSKGKMHLEHVSKLLSIYREEKAYLTSMKDLSFEEYREKGFPDMKDYLSWLNK